MSHEMICAWLKLPPTTWPPNHYLLLGLKPGEGDAARIERHVQERMERVRCYQLAQPELVTEAMNRIAQAFDCLRDPAAKKVYDAQLLGHSAPATRKLTQAAMPAVASLAPRSVPPSAPVVLSPAPLPATPALNPNTTGQTVEAPLDKNTMPVTPPPIQSVSESAAKQVKPGAEADVPTAPPPPSEEPVDPALEAARSGPARRRLGTKGALYQRISRTRQLIRAWVQAGKYLGDVKFQLTQKSEAIDLVRQLTIIRQQLLDFPPLLGQAGQPGYLVIALARQPEIVKTFQALSASQRRSYVRDWQAGLTFLAAYRLFLREELWKLRRATRLGRLCRAARSLFADFPIISLLLLALFVANVTWRPLREFWAFQAILVVGVLGVFIVAQSANRGKSLTRRRRPVKQ